jgi:microcystin-dependent protein
LHGATSVPTWMTACSRQYALVKDGTLYSTALYSALAAQLGSTFGGNGITTFGVPDERSRFRLAWDNSGTALRVTGSGSGINGVTMGAAGGNELLASHNHSASVSDPTHSHTVSNVVSGSAGGSAFGGVGGSGTVLLIQTLPTSSASTGISVSVGSTGGGSSANMPPTIVSFLALIKT